MTCSVLQLGKITLGNATVPGHVRLRDRHRHTLALHLESGDGVVLLHSRPTAAMTGLALGDKDGIKLAVLQTHLAGKFP